MGVSLILMFLGGAIDILGLVDEFWEGREDRC
jgi:hypothetical protein